MADVRRQRLRQDETTEMSWNGIDFVEVVKNRSLLRVFMLCPVTDQSDEWVWQLSSEFWKCPRDLEPAANNGNPPDPDQPQIVRLRLPRELKPGRYSLGVRGAGIDPRHQSRNFVYRHSPRTEIDPKPRTAPPKPSRPNPEMNYLAKDYASFRRLILDRLSVVMPNWKERHEADLGIMLVELMAYVGDYLSYTQDAVATEAYLGTARQRISVRRHARFVDYELSEGCNSRTFLAAEVNRNQVALDPRNVMFITRLPDPQQAGQAIFALRELPPELPPPFETFEAMELPRQPGPLTEADLKNETGLIGWLADRGALILNEFDPQTRASVRASCARSEPPEAETVQAVLRELNRLIADRCFVGLIREAGVRAFEADCLLVENVPDLIERNRLLLYRMVPHLVSGDSGDGFLRFFESLNSINFYTWDGEVDGLPRGSTKATLADRALPGELLVDEECSPFVRRMAQPTQLQSLQAGSVLIVEERIGPTTGVTSDADPNHRQAVRLTKVRFGEDPVRGTRIVEVEWNAEDALRFPLCLTARAADSGAIRRNVSIARGNVVAVDHGRRYELEQPRDFLPIDGIEPKARPDATFRSRNRSACPDPVQRELRRQTPANSAVRRVGDILPDSGLTFREPVEPGFSAERILNQMAHHSRPAIRVTSAPALPAEVASVLARYSPALTNRACFRPNDLENPEAFLQFLNGIDEAILRGLKRFQPRLGALLPSLPRNESIEDSAEIRQALALLQERSRWESRSHLLDSRPHDRHFTIEMDNDRRAHLRFPHERKNSAASRELFWIEYRVGNGTAGNVGAGSIRHMVYRTTPVTGIARVWNPLPADGGTAPETLQHARLHAPRQHLKKRRAVIGADYREIVLRDFPREVQAVAVQLKEFSTWTEVSIAVELMADVDPGFLQNRILPAVEKVKRIGHRVTVRPPVKVPLEIGLLVCVEDGYLRGHVREELFRVFSHDEFPDGQRGFFHADNFVMGGPIYLSRIVSAARSVSGVQNVTVTSFQRKGAGDRGERASGVMAFSAFEVAVLENDGVDPQSGRLELEMRGAR